MGLIDRLRQAFDPIGEQRVAVIPPWLPGQDNFLPYATLNGGLTYPINLNLTLPNSPQEQIANDFGSYVRQAYMSDSVVFSVMRDRMALFSQARFKFQSLANESLFGKPSLDIHEHPWPNGTTGDLLSRALNHADIAGNFYATRKNGRIIWFRPDWVTLLHGSPSGDPNASDAEFLGIAYFPGGENHPTGKPEYYQRGEICHFAPVPDPSARSRGMSWLTPVIREIMGDKAATEHKLRFLESGATPALAFKRNDSLTKENFDTWVGLIKQGHQGTANAYRAYFLDSGADVSTVGANLVEADLKVTQGAGETRIAAASGIHPVVAGLSEGMQGSSLNAGNFATARRLTADKTLWWLWGNFCGSMETLVPPPTGSRLWVDATGIAFLREDRKDAAEIQQIKATTIRTYIDSGFTAASSIAAAAAEDETLLVHTGLFSVQLQAPGSTKMPAGEVPGESPVGSGTGPETIPAGDVSTKPVSTVGATKPSNGKTPAK
jgi:phage portal protein BeeE